MSWSTEQNEQGPIVQNKTTAAPGQFPNIFKRYHQPSGRFVSAKADSQGVSLPGSTRSFVRLWDDDADGVTKWPDSSSPTGFARGQIVRMAQPAFVLTSLGPMLDPSDPATWRPGL